MKVTIKDVAKHAGVSIATVSRVLNKKNKVSDLTRKKVEKSIKELNYMPDLIARTMIIKETKTIGLIIPALDEYWATLSEYIQEHLWELGYTLMFCVTGRVDKQKVLMYINKFIKRKVDGIIYCGPRFEQDAVILELARDNIPLAILDYKLPHANTVCGNHLDGGKIAVEHLIKLGHKNIAYIGGPFSSPERELGYRNGLTLNNIKVNESLIIRGDYTYDHGYQSVNQLLNEKINFSAVCCGNDLIAIGAMEAMKKRNIRIPEDIALIGYDDIKLASIIKPKLTTIRQPLDKIAIGLVDLLLESIVDVDIKQSKNLVFSMDLIVRESCGARK